MWTTSNMPNGFCRELLFKADPELMELPLNCDLSVG